VRLHPSRRTVVTSPANSEMVPYRTWSPVRLGSASTRTGGPGDIRRAPMPGSEMSSVSRYSGVPLIPWFESLAEEHGFVVIGPLSGATQSPPTSLPMPTVRGGGDQGAALSSAHPFDDSADPSPREECGVFGVWAPGEEVAKLSYYGLYALQHRGQEAAGIAVADGSQIVVFKDLGLVSQVFDEQTLSSLNGHIAVGHCRYSTTGASVWENDSSTVAEVWLTGRCTS